MRCPKCRKGLYGTAASNEQHKLQCQRPLSEVELTKLDYQTFNSRENPHQS